MYELDVGVILNKKFRWILACFPKSPHEKSCVFLMQQVCYYCWQPSLFPETLLRFWLN